LEGELLSSSQITFRVNMRRYCIDAIELVNIMEALDSRTNSSTPLLAFFGDSPGIFRNDLFDVPFFAKYRAATNKENLDAVAWDGNEKCWAALHSPLQTEHHLDRYHKQFSPIIWRLNLKRHWRPLEAAARQDSQWELKKSKAIWRGVMTGQSLGSTDLEACKSNIRCKFVLRNINLTLIDCGLTEHLGKLSSDVVDGKVLTKSWVDMKGLREHKVIISLEGNDVSSGLKWNLQSESVVLMPPPTRTSWAMEELLQPWVHHIPMLPGGSNAEEMVQWVLNNDKEARRITERATLFIYDLVYHPDAENDE